MHWLEIEPMASGRQTVLKQSHKVDEYSYYIGSLISSLDDFNCHKSLTFDQLLIFM